ncbi:MAG: RNase H1/viroplasmin domain-containing protein, partial [Clostridia bacterium]|nr:RNase H1/viroplasmin domain-containing protein [Clostridia bacterium]
MAPKKKIYAVRNGSQTGIFHSWDDCRKAVTGYKGAEYCGFYTLEEAEAYLRGENFEPGHDIPQC